MLLLPAHHHGDAAAAGRMVIQYRFFQWPRIELAIIRQLQHQGGKSIGLAQRIDPEQVGLAFHAADNRIAHRQGQEQENAHQRHQQRQSGNIAGLVHLPMAAKPDGRKTKPPGHGGKTDQGHKPHQQNAAQGMAHGVMTHLMAQHRQHFVRCALVQKIVIQRNSRRAQEARNIGRNALGLARFIHQPDIVRRHAIGPRQRLDALFQRAIGQGGVIIVKRRDEHRIDHIQHNGKRNHDSAAPQPPGGTRLADGGIENGQHDHRRDQGQREAFGEIPQPSQERLVGQAVGMFADKTLINIQR